jgi:hypothetical protein
MYELGFVLALEGGNLVREDLEVLVLLGDVFVLKPEPKRHLNEYKIKGR